MSHKSPSAQRRAARRAAVATRSNQTSPPAPYKRGRVNSSAWSHRGPDGRRSEWCNTPFYFDAVEVDRRWSK